MKLITLMNERHSFLLIYVVFNYLDVYNSYSKSPITSGSPLVELVGGVCGFLSKFVVEWSKM